MPDTRSNRSSRRQRQEALEAAARDFDSFKELRKLSEQVRSDVNDLKQTIASLEQKTLNLQSAITQTLTFLFQLLDDPDAKAHAKAVSQDYFFNRGGSNYFNRD